MARLSPDSALKLTLKIISNTRLFLADLNAGSDENIMNDIYQ
jgi:hypothetical protein